MSEEQPTQEDANERLENDTSEDGTRMGPKTDGTNSVVNTLPVGYETVWLWLMSKNVGMKRALESVRRSSSPPV